MPPFAERLAAAVLSKGNPLAIGLDPRVDALPAEFHRQPSAARAIGDFCREVVELVADRVPCVKLQSAFFELHGHAGVAAYEATCDLARAHGLLVIGDVKRGDIGSTAEAYAEAHFRWADALTLHPLLGSDSVAPFLVSCRLDKGVFLLVRTSNASARQFQDLRCGERTLSEHLAEAVRTWGEQTDAGHEYSAVGAVVGATYPEQLAGWRLAMPRAWFLLPGVGAQGGRVEDLAPAFDGRGLGGLIAVSRAATQCFEPGDRHWRRRIVASIDALEAACAQLPKGKPGANPTAPTER